MTVREFVKLAQEIDAEEIKEGRDKTILDATIMIDCLEGDKFTVSNVNYDKKSNVLSLALHNGDRKWIEMGMKHPVMLTNISN